MSLIWLPSDPNYRQVLELAADNSLLSEIREVVSACLRGTKADPTRGATFYYNPLVTKKTPPWAVGREPSAIIGKHHFFALRPDGAPL